MQIEKGTAYCHTVHMVFIWSAKQEVQFHVILVCIEIANDNSHFISVVSIDVYTLPASLEKSMKTLLLAFCNTVSNFDKMVSR